MKKAKTFRPTRNTSAKSFNGRYKRDRLYDSRWNRYRVIFLNINKQCYVCGEPANIIDHIVAHKGDRVKFEAVNNHMPICKTCHDTVTGLFDKQEPPKTQEKIEWINAKRLEKNVTIVIRGLPRYG